MVKPHHGVAAKGRRETWQPVKRVPPGVLILGRGCGDRHSVGGLEDQAWDFIEYGFTTALDCAELNPDQATQVLKP
jgi:hypothetical protein